MDWPPYSYVPGGPWPHPKREPGGHLHGQPDTRPEPIPDEPTGAGSPALVEGALLFDSGYYWEAHEVWEGLWHAHGRFGPTADTLKALIKLAAAGVKVRERQPHGVRIHAARAAALFHKVRSEVGPVWLGLDLDRLAALSQSVVNDPPDDPATPETPVSLVFRFEIRS